MAEKPGYDVATGFQGGVTVGIHADTWEQFVNFCESAWPGEGLDVARGLYAILKNNALVIAPTEAQAQQMLQSQLGAVPIPPEQPPVYQPPYPQQPPAPPVYPQVPPQGYVQQPDPNGPPPGQTHDPNDPTKTKWVPPGFSQKTQRNYKGFWAKP